MTLNGGGAESCVGAESCFLFARELAKSGLASAGNGHPFVVTCRRHRVVLVPALLGQVASRRKARAAMRRKCQGYVAVRNASSLENPRKPL